jgi:hypothetical protein
MDMEIDQPWKDQPDGRIDPLELAPTKSFVEIASHGYDFAMVDQHIGRSLHVPRISHHAS